MRAVQMLGALSSAEKCRIYQLLDGFLLSCYMDLSKFNMISQVVTGICQNIYVDFKAC